MWPTSINPYYRIKKCCKSQNGETIDYSKSAKLRGEHDAQSNNKGLDSKMKKIKKVFDLKQVCTMGLIY